MELLRAYKQTEIWFHELTPPYDFPAPFDEDYALMLFSSDTSIPLKDRNRLCIQIVATKCYYAVCGGDACEQFHDTIDEASIVSDPDYNPPDERFIMTTWHTGESASEVFWYLLHCTNRPEERGPAPAVQRFLVLFVSPNENAKRDVITMMNKELDSRAEFDALLEQ